MVGVVPVGEVWVVGAAEPDGDQRWLLALDPDTGASVATLGLTRGDGPPSSCTGGLADGTLACLYGDTLEVLDPAAGTATARLALAEPAHSVYDVDGDILVLGFDDDRTTVSLSLLEPSGEQRWSIAVDLDEDELMALAGSHLPIVQAVPGLVLVGIGSVQLALDSGTGEVAWRGLADVLALGPDGGLVASSRGEPDWGISPRTEWLDESAEESRGSRELSWLPATANSGTVTGPVVADDGDGIVGLSPEAEELWRTDAEPVLRAPMVRADDVVVLQDTEGVVLAIEVASGEVRWRNDGGSLGWAARGWDALTDGERMVVRTAEGFAAVDLADGAPLWQARVPTGDAQVWALVDAGRALVAAGERTISAYVAAER